MKIQEAHFQTLLVIRLSLSLSPPPGLLHHQEPGEQVLTLRCNRVCSRWMEKSLHRRHRTVSQQYIL